MGRSPPIHLLDASGLRSAPGARPPCAKFANAPPWRAVPCRAVGTAQ